MLLNDLIADGARRYGSRIAVRFGDDAMTFTEVDNLSQAIAALLAARVPPGTAIGILANNGLLSLPLEFACAKARLVRVPLNARLSAAEHASMLRRVDVKAMIFSDDLAGRASELAASMPGLVLLGLDVLAEQGRTAGVRHELPSCERHDRVVAIFTSGTSGRFKAAVHTQASWGAITLNVLANLIDPRPGDGLLHAASLFHASGTLVMPFWLRGGAALVLPGFVPADYLTAVERWRPTALMLVPTMLAMLLDEPGFHPERLRSVDTIIYGASPMPRPLIERAIDLLGPRFVQFYGQTEAPLAIAALGKEDHLDPTKLLSCGRPGRDCDIRIVREEGHDAAVGEEGEVLVRAPFRMVGYHDEPGLDAETITADGWLRTRDIGRVDADGYLTLVDRASDMIVTGGYNVYPKEVEDALATHPSVREAIVIGIPDEKWGESVMAFVVLGPGEPADAEALAAHCRERLAGYKVPKQIDFLDALPLSAVGKPLRRALRDPYWAGKERRVG
jgi:acyl-CoA synthetase (AMP-forming)/AMP-acid ligase II